jgi:phospholipase/carboxylesterase
MTKLSGPMLAPRSGGAPTRIVVLLHGYGSDGRDLIDLGGAWGQVLPGALFVAPNAPLPCDGNPYGFQWFPLLVDRIAGRIEGAREAAPVIEEFLNDLWAATGLGAADTVLVGFSQGAMMALHVGTALDQTLAGVIAFTGALVPAERFGQEGVGKPPVALIHGDLDAVVDPAMSREAAELLTANGFEVSYHRSPTLAHGIDNDGLSFATSFLLARLG